MQTDAAHRCQIEEQAQEHKAQLADAHTSNHEQLAAAQQRLQEQIAQADSRLRAMKLDMLKEHEVLKRTLKDSEEAGEAQKAAHEKAISRMMAQRAQRVCSCCPWATSSILLM